MKFAVRALTLVLTISGIAAGVTTHQAPVQAQANVFSRQVISSAMPFPGCDTVQQCSARGK